MGARFRLWVIPKSDRWPPPKRRDWIPFIVVCLLLAGLCGGVVLRGGWIAERVTCRPGLLPSDDVWSQDGDCVGLSDGSYAFDLSGIDADTEKKIGSALEAIKKQNDAPSKCVSGSTPATVGALLNLNGPGVGGRAAAELEGLAAAQAAANQSGCTHTIRLLVAEMGTLEQAAVRAAKKLIKAGVVAVVGMGLSDVKGAEAAKQLHAAGIPMVADLITAAGFDKDGSAADRPSFTACADNGADYRSGLGDGFYRVAFRNSLQIKALGEYLRGTKRPRLDAILTPDDATKADPFVCTALPDVHKVFDPADSKSKVQEFKYDSTDPATLPAPVKWICSTKEPLNVFYVARGRDLARFITALASERATGTCTQETITVLGMSDAVRLRAKEPTEGLEDLREQALRSSDFAAKSIRVVYVPLADPGQLQALGRDGYKTLISHWNKLDFDLEDLESGWAVVSFESLTTVATVLKQVDADLKVKAARVRIELGHVGEKGTRVLGASGPLYFDASGNRAGSTPAVFQLCPNRQRPLQPTSSQVYPGKEKCP